MIRRLINAVFAAIAVGLPALAYAPVAAAQDTVTVTLANVNEAKGVVRIYLCDDPRTFGGPCQGPEGSAEARAGETTIVITGVKPATYAMRAIHDANNDGALNFPAEGYAFGNDTPYPPTFASASIKVAGPTSTRARMTYASASTAAPSDPMVVITMAGPVRMGAKGAPAPDGVTKTDVRENGLYGAFYAPTAKTNLPTLIVLGGSEGGLTSASYTALSFVRQGYAVLALAYFAEVGLPRTLEGVPLEYFDTAIDWLKQRPEVNPSKIGAVGGSRGSEAVLLMASHNKDVKAVMAFAPGGLILPGIDLQDPKTEAAWTLGGKDLPYVTLDYARHKPGTLDVYMPGLTAKPEAEIAVEKINGPILLISGDDDQLWPSTALANRITDRLKAKGFTHGFQHLVYPGAGHMVFSGDVSGRKPPTPGAPAAPAPGGMRLGGTPEANFKAWTDNWPKTLKFFDDALKGS